MAATGELRRLASIVGSAFKECEGHYAVDIAAVSQELEGVTVPEITLVFSLPPEYPERPPLFELEGGSPELVDGAYMELLAFIEQHPGDTILYELITLLVRYCGDHQYGEQARNGH